MLKTALDGARDRPVRASLRMVLKCRVNLALKAFYAPWDVMFPVSCLLLPGSSGFTLVLLSPGSDRSFSPVHLVPPRRGLRGPTLRSACIAAVVDPRAGVQVLGALSK